jgi:hypothetical protein
MRRKAFCMAAVSLCLLTGSAQAVETFNETDDYKDGEEIVNVFLKEDDYRLMVEDIERNGETFDWGWVKTAGAEPASAEPKKGGVMGKLRRGGGGRGNPAEPKDLGFAFSSYKTVSIPKVENFSGMIPPETPDKVRDSFVQAMQTLGLEVVEGEADLDLKVAIVDLKRDSTFIYVGRVDPFIELELRLKDVKTGENLILLRNQAHSNTPEDAAFNYANTLLKFLR